jgi:hypothetical protein
MLAGQLDCRGPSPSTLCQERRVISRETGRRIGECDLQGLFLRRQRERRGLLLRQWGNSAPTDEDTNLPQNFGIQLPHDPHPKGLFSYTAA